MLRCACVDWDMRFFTERALDVCSMQERLTLAA